MRQRSRRRANLVDLMLLAAFLTSVGATWAMTRPARASNQGLVALPSQIDLGEVDQREGISFEFGLENRWTVDIVITEVTRPCSCTRFDLQSGVKLAPLGAFRVPGSVDTRYRRGSYETAVAISYRVGDAKVQHTITMPIRMTIKPSVTATPEVVRIADDSWTTLTLGPGTDNSFRILAVEPSDPFILWEPVDSRLGEVGSSFRLRLKLDRSKLADRVARSSGPHWVKFSTSVEGEPQFQLPVAFDRHDGKEL